MRHTFSVLMLCLLAPAVASAAPARFGLLTCGLLYLDDATVRSELKLSAGQLAKLRSHRDQWLAGYARHTLFDLLDAAPTLDKANDKALTTLLDEEQWRRLRQLVLHDFRRRFGAFRTVRHDEVAAALKLRSEQVERLEQGETVEDVLSAEQRQRWNELLGPAPARPLQLSLPPPLIESWPNLARPDGLAAVVQPSIRAELKLDDKQRTETEKLRARWAQEFQTLRRQPPVAQTPRASSLAERSERDLAALLTAGQKTRLAQLLSQERLPEPALPMVVRAFLSGPLGKDLALTREQRHKLDNILAERDAALQKAATAETVLAFVTAAARADRQAEERLLASLENDQRQRLQDRLGPPFGGRRLPVNPQTLLPQGPRASVPIPLPLEVLDDLGREPFVSELGLTAEQRTVLKASDEKVRALLAEADTLSSQERRKKRDEAFRAGRQGLQETLKPEQARRLRELLLQHLERPPLGRPEFQPRALAGWKEMTDELKVTPEQLDQLDSADDVREVLTDEQWQKWQTLRGQSGSLLAGASSGPSFGLSARLRYVEEPAVRQQLKLDAEQERKLVARLLHWGEVVHRSATWPPAARAERLEAARLAARADAASLFTPAQMTRLSEVFRQQEFREAGPQGLLDDVELMTALGLSAEQRRQIDELARRRTVIDNALWRRSIRGRDAEQSVGFWTPIREAELARLEKLLDEKQRQTLGKAMGEPFEGPVRCYSLEALHEASDELRLFAFAPPR